MDSVKRLRDALIDSGYSPQDYGADEHIDALVTHACVCRTRADTPAGAFREFVAKACDMTRADRHMTNLRADMTDGGYPDIAAAMPEALFDLIMEGV